jgi:hypothetical protein
MTFRATLPSQPAVAIFHRQCRRSIGYLLHQNRQRKFRHIATSYFGGESSWACRRLRHRPRCAPARRSSTVHSLRVCSTPHNGYSGASCKNHDLCTKCLTHIKCGLRLCILYVRNGGRHGGLRIRAGKYRRSVLGRSIGRAKSCQIAWNSDPAFASNSDPPGRLDLST